jgi:ribosomal-protein-alanine N-acetyltransferase
VTRSDPLPPWPSAAPASGRVVLRRFEDDDVAMVRELSTDPYVPLIGTLDAHCDDAGARAYIDRQHSRYTDGTGYSFAIADRSSGQALGMIGLWLRDRGNGRAQAGYAVAPSHRGRSVGTDALRALVPFAWSFPELHRLELHIEPLNAGSIAVAERAGFSCEGVLRSHQEIGGRRRDLASYARVRDRPPSVGPRT